MNKAFSLWGSYVGLLMGIGGSYWLFGFIFLLAEQGRFTPALLVFLAIPPITGFLAGWQIHKVYSGAPKT